MFALKFLGVILIVLTGALAGFLKSRSLSLRNKKLQLFSDAVNTLYEYIEQGGLELEKAIKKAFCNCDFLKIDNGVFCDDKDLNLQEKAMIYDFFSDLGNSVKRTECQRIKEFKLKLRVVLEKAEKDALQNGKLYQSFGICIGLTIGILLI